MDALLDYCPFCGARLHDDEPLDDHLDERDDCRERFEAWQPTQRPQSRLGDRSFGFTPIHGILLVLIVLAVLGYSVLVVQQVLLGLLASGIVVLAFVVGSRY